MALTERIELDLRDAQRQIAQLEQQLNGLSTPIDVPVSVTGDQQLAEIRRELGLADDSVDSLNRELSQTDDELRNISQESRRVGDDLDSAGRRGSTAFAGLRGSVVGLIGAFGAIQGARAFLGFASDAIDAASDLEESTSKAQVVFGEFFDDIEAFAQTGPQALGLANAQALEFAGTFGNLFVALGLSQQAAADLAPEIVQLGADLASFNNIEVTEALDKLRAGLVGEAEPLRVLGVNLTAAATAAKAVELGLAESTNEVSEAAKVQARYALILEQTATAQGDFARTADGIANRQRTLNAEFEGFRAAVGEALLPVFETLLDTGGEILPLLEGLIPAFGFLGEVIGDVIDHLEVAGGLLGLVVDPIVDILGAAGAGADTSGFDALSDSARELIDPLNEDLRLLEELRLIWNTGLDRATFLGIFEDFNEELTRGDDAIGAAARALESFSQQGELTEDILRAIGDSAGLAGTDLVNLFSALAAGEFGPLSPPELELVLGLIEQLRVELAREFPPLSDFFGGAGSAAAAAAPGVREFTDALEDFEPPDFTDVVNDIESQLGRLPGIVDTIRTALEGEDGEVVGDASTITGAILDDLEELENFRADINLAEQLGLEGIADLARETGLDFAPALADAIANPEEAAELEDAINQFAAAEAAFLYDQTAAAIADEFSEPIMIPLDLVGAIQSFTIQGIGGLDALNLIGAGGAGPNVGAGGQGFEVNIQQNFDNTPGPNTETQRAAQQVAAVVSTIPQVN